MIVFVEDISPSSKALKICAGIIILAGAVWGPNNSRADSQAGNDANAALLYKKGENYYRGREVPRDRQQAAELYKQAAALGSLQAQNKLGYLYEQGEGVEQDLTTAFSWYRKAAEAGYLTAQYNLAEKYRLGIGTTKDEQQALAWCRRAALSGHRNAMLRLAGYYTQGVGGEQDYPRALAWYSIAMELGTLVQYGMKNALEGKMSQEELFQSENIIRELRASISSGH
ncbi:MAG: tetratricopeptide repeat protein [Gammaproteobacteria bacterium]